MALHCACGGLYICVDSRPSELDTLPAVRRRKRCRACGARTTTYELSARDLEKLTESAGKRTTRVLSALEDLRLALREDL